MLLLPLCAGCGDEETAVQELREQLEDTDDLPSGRSAQIRLVARVQGDAGGSPTLAGEARFAIFHGMDAEFAKSRIDMTEPAWDRLRPGQCSGEGELENPAGDEPRKVGRAGPLSWRDLNLVDVGAIKVALAGQELPLTYALAPDLVTWMSGIEYRHHEDSLPLGALHESDTTAVQISVSGSPEEDFPPLEIGASLPAPVTGLHVNKVANGDELILTWARGNYGQWPLLLRLRRGDEGIDCLVDDDGRFELPPSLYDPDSPGSAARGPGADARLDVSVTRFDYLNVAAGLFDDIDLVLETQLETQLVLAQPAPSAR
jgi:hypothetical protein